MSAWQGDHRRSHLRSSWLWVLLGVCLGLSWGPARFSRAEQGPPPPMEEEEGDEGQDQAADSEPAKVEAAETGDDEDDTGEADAGDQQADEADEAEADDEEQPDPGEDQDADEGETEEGDEAVGEESDSAEADLPEPGEEEGVEADEDREAETGEDQEQVPDPTEVVVPPKGGPGKPLTARERAEQRRKQAAERAKKRRANRGKVTPPVRTPRRPPTRAKPKPASRAAEPAKPEPRSQDQPKPSAGEDKTVVDIDIEEPEFDILPEEREYQFSFEEAEYADLLNAFSRMSGLPIIGDAPKGKVTFKTTEVMDFGSALNRIRLLLFKHHDVHWLFRKGNILEVIRVTEYDRVIEMKDIYWSLEKYRSANREENDLVMLVYTPEKGSVDDLMMVRDFLPDYVRMAPLEDPTKNKMTVFALAKDINKFLDLVDVFFRDDDPRTIKKIPVEHITPSRAIESLGQLMDLSGAGRAVTPRVAKKGRKTQVRAGSREIKLLPDDAQQVIIVRALPGEIEEIERLLPYIDVETETKFQPVVIHLEHMTAEQMVARMRPLLSASGSASKPARAAGRKPGRARPKAAPPGAVTGKDVTVVPEPRTNTLIVLGSEERVADVKLIVALLDVATVGDQPTVVKLVHADAQDLAGKLAQMMELVRPRSGFKATPHQVSNSLYLVGSVLDLELAQDLIGQWDVPGAEPSLHKARLEHARASEVANMLSRIEGGRPQPAAPRRTTGKQKGRKVTRRTPQRGVSGAGKFIGDDANNIIYVLCTDEEWENDYWPHIQELESDARPSPLDKHRIATAEGDPQEVIDWLTQALDAELPRMLATADGILLLNATAGQIEQIEALVTEYPVPGTERRIFEIKYADPNQVREVVMTMMSSGKVPVRRTAPKKGAKKRTPMPRAAAAGTGITIVPSGSSLIVRAPGEKMAEIAELIAQVDVEAEADTDIRIYPFPPGVNVQDLAGTLGRLFGGATPGRKPAGKRQARPAVGRITFIAQPAAHKILVSAPVEDFERIEEIIQRLGTEGDAVETVYKFIEVNQDTAATIVQLIEPMLQNKLDTLIANGTIPQPQSKGKAARQLLTIQADPRDDRIIVSAPQVLIPEVEALVEMVGRPPGEQDELIVRTVMLQKTDPEEMAQTIRAMLSGQQPRPQRPSGKGQPKRRPVPVRQPAGKLDVVVAPAPGGGALVLAGAAREVEEVEGWIKKLDADAESGLRFIKLYDLKDADPEQVADTLMAVVDSGAGMPGRKAAKAQEDDLFGGWETEITRQGKDLYLSANLFTSTMLVAATPAKMRQVDDIVKMFVGDDETGEGPDIPPASEVLPYMTYELKTTDAFDAVYTLENILDALWPYQDKPQVEYIPFTDILVVKGNPEHFDEVEKLIVKYVDQGTGRPAVSRAALSVIGAGMTAQDTAMLLKAQLESQGLDVDIMSVSPPEPGELEEIHPCVLPDCAFAGLRAAAACAVAQQTDDRQQPGEKPETPQDQDEDRNPEALFRSLMEAQNQRLAPADVVQKAPDEEEPAPKLRIYFDDKGGKIVLEGAASAIDSAEDLIKSIKDELKDVPSPPDIRIYRLKYVSVTKAADILDNMFNDRQRRAQQQRMQQLQRRLQQQQQRQQRQQQQGGQKGQRGQQPAGPQGQQQQPEAPPQSLEMSVAVYPNPRDRTLIIKAATEAFPSIVSLLKKIDKPSQAPMDYKIFTFKNLLASEVEEQLKALLGQQSSRRSRGRTPARRGRTPGGGAQAPQDDMLQMELGGQGSAIAAEEITIASNAKTNSIMVMAPQQAMELVERFIEDMKDLGTPQFVTETYVLKHADATVVVPQLEKLLSAGGRGKAGKSEGFDPTSLNAPMFMADGRTNSIIVRAVETDIPKIAPLIRQLDVPFDDQGGVKDYPLINADAVQVAKTLQAVFGKQGGGRKVAAGAMAVSVVGDGESNTVFVTAPAELQEEIAAQIDKMDRAAFEAIRPRVIKVANAVPTEIARKIQEALGDGKKRSKSRIKITGDDAGRQMLVVAPEEIMPQIESLVGILDQAPSSVDVRIFPLQYAQATEVLQGLNKMVNQAKAQLVKSGVQIDIFSASADERSNSLVVLGGQMTFMLVEKVLRELDVERDLAKERSYKSFKLTYAESRSAKEVIDAVFRLPGRAGANSRDAVTCTVDGSTNSVVVTASPANMERVEALIAEMDREDAASRDVKMIPLQYTDAAQTLEILQEYLRKPAGGRGRDGELAGDVRISAATATNSLVISGDPEELERLAGIIAQIDVEVADAVNAPKIIKLSYAQASEIEPRLTSLFAEQKGRRGPRGGATMVPVIVADDGSNSLIVRASAVDFNQIKTLVAEIDTEEAGAGSEMKIVTLKPGVNATEMADMINDILDQQERNKPKGPGRGGSRAASQQVLVSADVRTNSLILTGPQSKFDQIERLVRNLEGIGPKGGTMSKVIRIKGDPDEIRQLLEQVVEESKGGGSTSKKKRGGRSRRR